MAAIGRLRRALDETEIAGIQTTLPFHRFVARDPSFAAGELSTGWVAEHWDGPASLARAVHAARLAVGLDALASGLAVAGSIGEGAGARVPAAATSSDRSNGHWARVGRQIATERWPR